MITFLEKNPNTITKLQAKGYILINNELELKNALYHGEKIIIDSESIKDIYSLRSSFYIMREMKNLSHHNITILEERYEHHQYETTLTYVMRDHIKNHQVK